MSNKIEIDKTVFDTLIYFCFGITLNEEADKIVEIIIKKAYIDATNQGAFNTKIPKEDISRKKLVEEIKEEVVEELKKELLRYQNHTDKMDFDEWHNNICKGILSHYDKINEDKSLFTYGNAQKLINMSLKYLYMLSRVDNFSEIKSGLCRILEEIRKDEYYLNIPIDSYIIDSLWEKPDIYLPILSGDRNKQYSHSYEHVEGWSNWTEEMYMNLICSINKSNIFEGKTPLDWESEQWIVQAKIRRGNYEQ